MPLTITPGTIWKTADVVTPDRLNRAITDQQLSATPLTILGVPPQSVDAGSPQPASAPVEEILVTPAGLALLKGDPADTDFLSAAYSPLLNAIYPIGAPYTTIGDAALPTLITALGAWEKRGAIPIKTTGATTERPDNPPEGYPFYDTTIGAALVYAGGSWVTRDGLPGDVKSVTDTDLSAALAKNPGWQQHAASMGKVLAGATTDASDTAHAPGATAGKESDTIPASAIETHYHYLFKNSYAQNGSGTSQQGMGLTSLYPFASSTHLQGNADAWDYAMAGHSATPDIGRSSGPISNDGTPITPTEMSLMQPTLYLYRLVKSALGTPSPTPSNDAMQTIWIRTA